MSKITKKQLHNGWYCHDTEIIKMKKELRELKQSVLRLEKLTDEKLLDEPQLKQLDQSIFDGLDEKWRFAAINVSGALILSTHPIVAMSGSWVRKRNLSELINYGFGYDTSNWQNSLIERDTAKELLDVDLSSELTGSELCKAMINRGDKIVLCIVKDYEHENDIYYDAITHCSNDYFESTLSSWRYATPINNQGEPLTASEVGL